MAVTGMELLEPLERQSLRAAGQQGRLTARGSSAGQQMGAMAWAGGVRRLVRDGMGKEGKGDQADATVSTWVAIRRKRNLDGVRLGLRAWLDRRLLGMGAGTWKEGGLMPWGMWRQK